MISPCDLETALMRQGDLDQEEAHAILCEARADVAHGADPEEVLWDLGLEPDYIFDLL